MKRIAALILFLLFNNSFAQEAQTFEFNKIYSYVLQGDVAKVLKVLDTLPEEHLNLEEKMIKKKFIDRFKLQKENIDYNTTNPVLQDLLNIYQTYWRQALLNKDNLEHYERELKSDVTSFLKKHNYAVRNDYVKDTLNEREIAVNFTQHLKNFLAGKDYYSATGKTAGLFDLFIWKREVPTEYKVVLPETAVTTTIIFLEDVVTMGWEEYASFGKVYPGGWATKEVLYAVGKAYDTRTEDFEVSYLKHESQHFADYMTYPKLSGADLEYRAKLTELIYAEETFYNLIKNFIRNASPEGRNPHAFGAYALIRDLSQLIFSEDFVSEIEQWKAIEPERIKKESRDLLKAHSTALEKAGADSVIELIR